MCCIVESYNSVSTYFLNLQRYGYCTKNDVSIKDLFGKCDQNPLFPADLVTFTEEILMENFIFCAVGFLAEILLIYLLFQFRSKLYIFFLSGFSFTNTEDLQDSRGLSSFLSTTSTCSVTFENLLVVLHLRLLPHIFKHSAC